MHPHAGSVELVVQQQDKYLQHPDHISLIDLREHDVSDDDTFCKTSHKPKLTVSHLELIAHPQDDFYHSQLCSKCCYCCCCGNTQSVWIRDCLSQTFQLPKRTATIFCIGLIFYVVFVVIQLSTIKVGDEYCTISNATYLSLEIVRSLIAFFNIICVLFAFNRHLFLQQLLEFETMYKLSNCAILLMFVLSYELLIRSGGATGESTHNIVCNVYSIIKYLFYVIDISFFIVLVICIDAWHTNRIIKLCVIMAGFCGLIYYYHYYAQQYCGVFPSNNNIYDDYITIPILNYSLSVYYTTRNAIETLLIFIFKQICMFIYNEIEFSWCTCGHYICTCGQRHNTAVSISVHPILHWKSNGNTRINNFNSNNNSKISSTTNQTGSFYKNLIDVYDHDENNFDIDDNYNCNYNIIQADESNDFYHTKCCQKSCIKFMVCLCKFKNKNIEDDGYNIDQTSMADKIGNEFRHGLSIHKCWYGSLYVVIIGTIIGLNLAVPLQNENALCLIIATFFGLILVVPCFLAFNVNLVKSQLYQFETIYKLYLVMTFITCEASYYVTTNIYSESTNGRLLIVFSVLRMPLWILTIVGASSIDAWNVHFYVKLISLATVNGWIGVWYLYFELISDRTSDDYFQFTVSFFQRISNAYFVQQYSLMTLWIFFIQTICFACLFCKAFE